MNYWVIIYRFAWGLLVVLCVIGLVCIFLPKCQSLREIQNEKLALQEENRATEEMIQELRTKQEQFRKDPEFVERTARDAGMVKPDETVFKFTRGDAE